MTTLVRKTESFYRGETVGQRRGGRDEDPHYHEAAVKAPMVLGDAGVPGQRKKDFHGAVSRETAAGHRSARVVVLDTEDATSKRGNCFQ